MPISGYPISGAPISGTPVIVIPATPFDWLAELARPTRPSNRNQPTETVSTVHIVVPFDWNAETSRPLARTQRRSSNEATSPPSFVQLDWVADPTVPPRRALRRPASDTVSPPSFVQIDWTFDLASPVRRAARRPSGETTSPPVFTQLDWLFSQPVQPPRQRGRQSTSTADPAPVSTFPDWQPIGASVSRSATRPAGAIVSPFALASDGTGQPAPIIVVVSVPDPRATGNTIVPASTGGGGAGWATELKRNGIAYPGPARLTLRVGRPLASAERNRDTAADERWLLSHLLEIEGL